MHPMLRNDTITVKTRRGPLTFPATQAAAENMGTGYMRSMCDTNDPNGEWGTRTTLFSECESCQGDGCQECEYDGYHTRFALDDEVYDEASIFERGVERADLIEGALQFGREILSDSLTYGSETLAGE